MNTLKIYDNLLKFMYGEFKRGNNASGYGEYIQILIKHFERDSQDNRIGDAHAQIQAVGYFLKNGWIEAVDISGNKITNPMTAYTTGRMQPTQLGRYYLQQRQLNAVTKVINTIAEAFGRFVKGLKGP